jgi:hypothetical protein
MFIFRSVYFLLTLPGEVADFMAFLIPLKIAEQSEASCQNT